jgi:hypothetical protein
VCLKWECTGTPTITKCSNNINYVNVDASAGGGGRIT